MIDFYDTIKNKLLTAFDLENKVISILAHGKSVYHDGPINDYDIIVILENYKTNDDSIIRHILEQFEGFNIDFSLAYLSDIQLKGEGNFQFGNHGLFYAKVLGCAEVIYGDNIFTFDINPLDERISLLQQIEEYYFRLNKIYFNSAVNRKKQYRKYLMRAIIDMLLATHELSYQNANIIMEKNLYEHIKMSTHLSNVTKNLVKNIFHTEGNVDSDFLRCKRAFYEDYLSYFKKHID